MISCKKVDQAINELNRLGINYESSGPKSKATIIKAQEVLGQSFPNSYQYFLEKLGNFDLNTFHVQGLIDTRASQVSESGIVWSVLNDRKNFSTPDYIITLDDDLGDGSAYALDLSQMDRLGECPVVIWPLDGFQYTPKLETISPDFGTWFLEKVKEQIDSKD